MGYIELSVPASGSQIAAWYPADVTDAESLATPSLLATGPQTFPVVVPAPGDAGSLAPTDEGQSFNCI